MSQCFQELELPAVSEVSSIATPLRESLSKTLGINKYFTGAKFRHKGAFTIQAREQLGEYCSQTSSRTLKLN